MRASLLDLRPNPRFADKLHVSTGCPARARLARRRKRSLMSARSVVVDLACPACAHLASSSQIYFASRTHSQLSQFVAELRKTAFARSDDPYPSPTLPTSSATSAPTPEASRPVRIIPLGSRQTLCINDDVRRKSGGSNEAMGDLCTELQKGGKDRCPYLPPLTEPAKLNDFRDKALVRQSFSCSFPQRRLNINLAGVRARHRGHRGPRPQDANVPVLRLAQGCSCRRGRHTSIQHANAEDGARGAGSLAQGVGRSRLPVRRERSTDAVSWPQPHCHRRRSPQPHRLDPVAA